MTTTRSNILVSGANSQIATEIRNVLHSDFPHRLVFFTKSEWNICDLKKSEELFSLYKPAFYINAAAYTAVDKAESDEKNCYAINTEAVEHLAKLSAKINCIFIHFSTDYVFNSQSDVPIKEESPKNPIGVYATSKSKGEDLLMLNNPKHIIVRTSWLYSSFSSNFVKTMLKLSETKSHLSIVRDQKGSPTYAKDLASVVLDIIKGIDFQNPSAIWGKYHFSNSGETNWFDFAIEIFRLANKNIKVIPITTEEYNAPAHRPRYSVLDCSKILNTFNIRSRNWKEALSECMSNIQEKK